MINKKVISLVLSLALIVSCFASVASLGVYAIDNTKKTTSLQTAPVVTTTTAEKKAARTVVDPYPTDYYPTQHCECGNIWLDKSGNTHYLWGEGNCKNDDNKGCDGTILEWQDAGKKFTTSANVAAGGNYYLTSNVGAAMITPDNGATLRLDLNGYTYNKPSNRLFSTDKKSNVTIVITDTKGTGTVTMQNSNNQGGFWLTSNSGNTARIYGGAFTMSGATYGGITYVSAGNSFYAFEGTSFDGSATKAGSSSNGPAICVLGDIGLYNTSIIGGTTTGNGGAIYQTATANAKYVNTTISGGNAKLGGNIFMGAGGTLDLEGCTVQNGHSTSAGGNIFVDASVGKTSTTKLVNTTISGGVAASVGGNIRFAGASKTANGVTTYSKNNVTITGCTITGGEAGKNGGNIAAGGSGNAQNRTVVIGTFNNTTISGGTAAEEGGNLYIAAGAGFYPGNNVVVSGGKSTGSSGGNLFVNGGGAAFQLTADRTDVKILNGTAATSGGNVYYGGGTFTPRNATISGGTATNGNGGNVYYGGNGKTLENTTITGGTAGGLGQSVYANAGDSGSLTIKGTTSIDGEVYLDNTTTTDNSHVLSGNIDLDNLVIGAPTATPDNTDKYKVTINVADLGQTADINLTVATNPAVTSYAGQTFADETAQLTRVIAKNVTAEKAACFTSTHENYRFQVVNGTEGALQYYVPVVAHRHAVDGKDTANPAINNDHTDLLDADYPAANTERTYTYAVSSEEELLDAIANFTASSDYINIYLTDNITLTEKSKYVNVKDSTTLYGLFPVGLTGNKTDKAINICLNGHNLTAYDDEANGRIYLFGAHVNTNIVITDCQGGGKLIYPRDNTTVLSGVFYQTSNARIILSGITVEGGSGKESAITQTATARFYASDTTFTGSKNATNGGSYGAFRQYGGNTGIGNCSIRLYGCTVSPTQGTAINSYVSDATKGATVVLKDCTINGATTNVNNNQGRALHINNAGLTTSVYTATNTIFNCPASTLSSVYATGAGSTNFTISGGSIQSTNGKCIQTSTSGFATLTDGVAISAGADCGFAVQNLGTFSMTGGSITSAATKAKDSSAIINAAGATLTLNGVTVTQNGTSYAVENKGTLNTTNGSITSAGNIALENIAGATATTNGTNISNTGTNQAIENQGKLDMTGGTVSSNSYTIANNAATSVLTMNSTTVTTTSARGLNNGTSGDLAASATLTNCNFTGSASTTTGGAVQNFKNATLNIIGGTYTGSSGATKEGGTIYSAGNLSISDGAVIQNGHSASHGGNLYIHADSGTVSITNATITGGTATKDGGNIYVSPSVTLQVYDNAVVSDGTAQRGGNIYNYGGTVSISGSAKIKDGNAYNAESYSGGQGGGGNIYSTNSGTLTIGEGVEISGGDASGNGGNIYNNATMTITGATVTGGTAGHNGGNIIFSSSTAAGTTITDSSITNGHANRGGNIYATKTNNVSLVGTTVSGGTIESNADSFGADVLIYAEEEAKPATIYGDANCIIGKVAMVYPFAQNNFAEGTYNPTIDYVTLDATKEDMVKSSTITEKVAGENPDSAFNNWYLLARGQKKNDGSNWIRFTSLVDSDITSYYAAGYFITVQGEETADMETHDVYKTNYENSVLKQIGDYSLSSDYYFHVDLQFSAADIEAGKTVTIRPYLLDKDGNTYYYGATKTASLAKLFPATVPVEGE